MLMHTPLRDGAERFPDREWIEDRQPQRDEAAEFRLAVALHQWQAEIGVPDLALYPVALKLFAAELPMPPTGKIAKADVAARAGL